VDTWLKDDAVVKLNPTNKFVVYILPSFNNRWLNLIAVFFLWFRLLWLKYKTSNSSGNTASKVCNTNNGWQSTDYRLTGNQLLTLGRKLCPDTWFSLCYFGLKNICPLSYLFWRRYKCVKLTLNYTFWRALRHGPWRTWLLHHLTPCYLHKYISPITKWYCRRGKPITDINLMVVWDTLTQFHRWIIPRDDTKVTRQVRVTSKLLCMATVLKIVHTGYYHG
jgi:hypothetical protein